MFAARRCSPPPQPAVSFDVNHFGPKLQMERFLQFLGLFVPFLVLGGYLVLRPRCFFELFRCLCRFEVIDLAR